MNYQEEKKQLNIVVTGGNNGIGYETAKGLYFDGHNVIIGSRNDQKNTEAVASIKASGASSGSIRCFRLDLAKRASIQSFAKDVADNFKEINILVNNAGLMLFQLGLSELKIQNTMTINHFGPFYLTYLLFPLMKNTKKAKIINVSSMIHYSAGTGFMRDLALQNSSFSAWAQYQKSKLANVVFTVGLNDRLKSYANIKTVSLHPGIVDSGFGADSCCFKFFKCICCCCVVDEAEGARTSLYLARAPFETLRSGEYYHSDTNWKEMNAVGRDPKEVQELWDVSEKAYGIKFSP